MKYKIKNRTPERKVIAYRGKCSGNLFLPVDGSHNRFYTIYSTGAPPGITTQGAGSGMSEANFERLYEGDVVEITL